MFEQEERDAGGTSGFDVEDDYEEEALADDEEEGRRAARAAQSRSRSTTARTAS